MKKLGAVCFSLLLLMDFAIPQNYPVLLVPGLGGSMLFSRTESGFCNVPQSYFWVSVLFIMGDTDCFVEAMRLIYDNKTHTTHDNPGIDVFVTGFGTTTTISNLDPDSFIFSAFLEYYGPLITMLQNNGYNANSLRGAPYDFRRAPNEMEDFYDNVTALVEEMYEQNNQQPVVVIGHSMGNPVMLYFYNHKSQAWKDKYIQSHVSLAGVWGGSVKALEAITGGITFRNLPASMLRKIERSMPSIHWFLPSSKFWGPDEALLILTGKHGTNFTSSDYKQLYQRLPDRDGYDMWQDTKDLIYDLTPPGVEVHCLYGYNVPTVNTLYSNDFSWPDLSNWTFGDGDGTVNIRSLQGCLQWAKEQKQPVHHLALLNLSHVNIIDDERTFHYIQKVLHLFP